MAPGFVKVLCLTATTATVAMTAIAMAGAAAVDTARTVPQAGLQVAQAVDAATLVREGSALFARECAVCHGPVAQGGDGPKLAGNANLAAAENVINQVLRGGGYMPPFGDALNDRQVAAVSSFVRSSFGNSFGPVQPADVTKLRGM